MREKKILVLGSDSAARMQMSSRLRKVGWMVLSAEDAQTAVDLARKQKPAAIVIDGSSADSVAMLTLKRLRSTIGTTMIAAICVISPDSPEVAEFRALGVHEFIDPPGEPQAIDAALRRHLAQAPAIPLVPAAILAENHRMEELKLSELLDSKREESFDRLTRLAAALLRTPTALVSVIDPDRQFFKSQTGLPEPWASMRQTPLTHSFCQWVAGGFEELVVDDARSHPVLRSNRAVHELNVIAYAGVPFSRTSGGDTLGSFCVIDSQPREWLEADLSTLRDLSRIVQSYIAAGSGSAEPQPALETVAHGMEAAARLLVRAPDPHRSQISIIIQDLSEWIAKAVATSTSPRDGSS